MNGFLNLYYPTSTPLFPPCPSFPPCPYYLQPTMPWWPVIIC